MSSDCDIDDLKTKLAEAETAYHTVMLGGKTASVTFGPSKSVTYTQANLAELRRYINDLRDQIAACGGDSKARRTIRMVF